MRLLIVYCHPVEGSFGSAVRDAVIDSAREAGHEIRLTDLYAEGFDPVMRREERIGYHEPAANEVPVAEHLANVRWAEGLIFVHPTWWYGPPAMLKGWLDRVFVPHVAFQMPTETTGIRPGLTHIRLIGQVSTLGSSWWLWRFMGQPGRRIILRGLRACCAPACRTFWLGLHAMDTVPEPKRRAFLARVRRRIARIR
ncbi:NAD(P)H-dependent oxidoreductase [Albimonas pacifica]|uniref:Putative NADPH-quinone reductase (Modulator of drug activity B) n=1 Tax=Albimonas pacifica TaxID=1114924 RepID=A0A1I3JXQ4_9RHOB|nr:NAD(P)H-dependent oxidoreductase [Albimonas pacifica]SFI65011.1 Putative NADPH-quinone reductase (modulator of drug activity B) [Albimonas pacifica]